MTGESPNERQQRLSSTVRGVVIGVILTFYGYLIHQPGGSPAVTLLIAAGLQLGVILMRRYVPNYLLPQAMYVFELLVDAATVLFFAMGVLGGITDLASAV